MFTNGYAAPVKMFRHHIIVITFIMTVGATRKWLFVITLGPTHGDIEGNAQGLTRLNPSAHYLRSVHFKITAR